MPVSSIVIATRESALALWQARHVQERLQALYPDLRLSILGITTRGDRNLDTPLANIGGKGLFVKELEIALSEGRADIAVHSMKDVPMRMPDGYAIAALCRRADPRDAVVSKRGASLEELPAGSVVGTSSMRRASQLKSRFPGLEILPLRGNVQTRLGKLDAGQYAAIVLAVAGLERLGLGGRITSILSPEQSLPAIGQGALAIETLSARSELSELLTPMNDPETEACVTAERAYGRALGASCQVPLGGYAQIRDGVLTLRGFVASVDGVRMVSGEVRGKVSEPDALGKTLAQRLLGQGAAAILAELAAGHG
ncbi:MAG: hydroxymethylbilane synthase [Burkholderiales bacterium]